MTEPRASASMVGDGLSFGARATGFEAGTHSPREVLEGYLARLEAVEPQLHAFVAYDLDAARRSADAATARWRAGRPLSPIDGMPVGVKDIIATADFPTRMGSPLFADAKPEDDAACVQAVRDGGGIVIGKTVTTEFATGASGPTVNPHDPAHSPGGSSSGSAAAVAAGMIAAGFGTQTLGSILRPAGFCGIVGYKPSHGSLSLAGIHPVSATLDHLGVLAVDVEDAWRLARWVAERAPGTADRGLGGPVDAPLTSLPLGRVACLRLPWQDELDAASQRAFEGCLASLRGRGVEVVEPDGDPALAGLVRALAPLADAALDLMCFEMRWPYAGYRARRPDALSAKVNEQLERGLAMTTGTYAELRRLRLELAARVESLADAYDAFVLPAGSGPAPEGLSDTGSRTALTYWSYLGLPAIALPLMQVGHLPMGLQLAGFGGQDRRLVRQALGLMRAFER